MLFVKMKEDKNGAKKEVKSVKIRRSRKTALLLAVLMDVVVTSSAKVNAKRRQREAKGSKNAKRTKISKQIAEEPVQLSWVKCVKFPGNVIKTLWLILQ